MQQQREQIRSSDQSNIDSNVSSDDFVHITSQDSGISFDESRDSERLESRLQQEQSKSYSFDVDLWDQLSAISTNFKRGNSMLTGFTQFCKTYNKVLQQFSLGLYRSAEQWEKEMMPSSRNFDTSSIAISNVKQGLEEFANVVQDKTSIILQDLVEPIEQYQKHYVQNSNESISSAKTFWYALDEERKKIIQTKDKYYRLMNDVEQSEISIELALLEHEKGNLSLDQVQRITNQTLNVKYKAEIASQDYKKGVEQMNTYLSQFETDYRPILQRLQQGEESRINFMKYSFEKFLKHQGQMGKSIFEKAQEIQSQVSMINSDTDLKIFIDENKSFVEFQSKVEFQPYEVSKDVQAQKSELIIQINQQKNQNSAHSQAFQELKNKEIDEKQLYKYISQLLRGQDITFDEKSEIISSLHNAKIRDSVADYLKTINSPKVVDNPDALKTLGEILKYLLTAYVHEKDENYKVIYAILHCSQQVMHLKESENSEKSRVYLTQYLNDHGVWQEHNVWKVCIQKIINQKFHEAINSSSLLKPAVPQKPQPEPVSTSSIFSAPLGKLKGFWGLQSSKQEEAPSQQNSGYNSSSSQGSASKQPMRIPKSLAQNIIFNCISKFLYHFVNFQLSFENSREILLSFCNKYELDQNRTHLLLSELESIQKKTRFQITQKEIREMSLMKRMFREEKYGRDKFMVVALSIKYIDSDISLRNILIMSKKTKLRLSQVIYKQALLVSQPERLSIKRIPIWEIILNIRENQSDYYAFRDKVALDNKMIKEVEEVINMDVQRSFTKTKVIEPQVLSRILKTYAFFNPEIQYCQGMNFVAGFLLLVFRDEEKVFKAMQAIVHQNDMADLFNQELPKLKLFFYQFDRLLNIQMPQLHSHFKDEMVNSSYYSSPWFITIFTQSLQNQESDVVSAKLLQLWDYFLTSGWKAVFKMGMFVIKENEQELQRMGFENILNYIMEKPKLILSEPGSEQEKLAQEADLSNLIKDQSKEVFYKELRESLKTVKHLGYILTRLEREFKDSLDASQLIRTTDSTTLQTSQESPNRLAEERGIQDL